MPAAVAGVTSAGDESVGFERIEQRDDDARVYAHRVHELALREPAVVVQQPEDLKLPRLEVVRRVRGAQPAHRLLPEQRQQQPRA